jgi:polar amino acid transport system substrate-binding protein
MAFHRKNEGECRMLLESLTKLAARLLAVSLLCFLSQAPASAADCAKDTLCRILTEGKLKAGAVVDYKPWAYRGANGEFMGMEPDMARDVAKTLGVEVEFVPVNSANRMQFLQQGQIDLMIATMTDTLDRRKVIGIVHPNYYSSGYNIVFPKSVTPADWKALKGQKICAIQGSWY